jgi:hypothetical protein
MNDGRKRREAKQARRDVRRRAAKDQMGKEETAFIGLVRKTLDTRRPLDMLCLAAYCVESLMPDWRSKLKSEVPEQDRFGTVITNLCTWHAPEVTALLAVMAELMVDRPELQRQCRLEVVLRNDRLPDWITQLPDVQVYRATRMADVLGDYDELVVGVRLADGHELNCVAAIDHSRFSYVCAADMLAGSMDSVLAAMAGSADPDNSFVAMPLADARAWLEQGMAQPFFQLRDESRPGCEVMLRWLVAQLPEGGQRYQSPGEDWKVTSSLLNTFFASPQGAPFARDYGYKDLLGQLLESGAGDPLQWSAFRVIEALRDVRVDDFMLMDNLEDVPDLLRAFIPIAHALSGIRDQLTAQALAAIDKAKAEFLERVQQAKALEDDEDWTWTA